MLKIFSCIKKDSISNLKESYLFKGVGSYEKSINENKTFLRAMMPVDERRGDRDNSAVNFNDIRAIGAPASFNKKMIAY